MYKESLTYTRRKIEKVSNVPEIILVHHTGGTDANPLEDTSHHTAKTIEEWHMKKGWNGIGYHYVIEKDGTIVHGRPEHVEGAHEPKVNKKSIGICLSGNFDATLPTIEQTASLKVLLKDINSRYTIREISPHRRYASKTCFGKKLSDTWASDLIKETVVQKDILLKDATLKELVNELQIRI